MNVENNLTENEELRFRVVCQGSVLLEAVSRAIAERFVAKLTGETQREVQIVPVTQDGNQVLLG